MNNPHKSITSVQHRMYEQNCNRMITHPIRGVKFVVESRMSLFQADEVLKVPQAETSIMALCWKKS